MADGKGGTKHIIKRCLAVQKLTDIFIGFEGDLRVNLEEIGNGNNVSKVIIASSEEAAGRKQGSIMPSTAEGRPFILGSIATKKV